MLMGDVVITNCFVVGCQAEGETQVSLKNLWLLRSFFAGDVTIEGKPKELVNALSSQGLFPGVTVSHLEGSISMILPNTSRIASGIIKPENSTRDGKTIIENLVESIPFDNFTNPETSDCHVM
jgi:hypothetical protein